MTVSAGSRLGPYEIVSPLGAGGMGEVYRARDTRLGRDVAIKVLPEHLLGNADLKQRFEREAKAISSLQHPHICTLFDVGSQDGVDYLVMECLEGENLAERLRRGALPIEQILNIGGEIADALDKAHRSGIVHRDLKPANIMLTKSGAKLMDFGLAKPASIGASAASNSAPLLSAAMTMSSPSPHSPLTSAGTLVGTILYMSPEQLQGIEADSRSDIFALGAVLYEMATGKRAFEGKSQIKVASAILEDEPPAPSSVSSAVPPGLEYTIQTCLAKDPNDRFQSAHDVLLQLRWAGKSPVAKTATQPSNTLIRAAVAVAVFAVLVTAIAVWTSRSSNNQQTVRALIPPPEKLQFDQIGDFSGPPLLAPTGDKIVFSAHGPSTPRSLWVRPLDSFEAQRLEGTDNGYGPFWSPDGKTVAFFANGKLNRIPVSGGPVTVLADAPNARGGAWATGDVILFAPNFQGALYRVSANGGTAQPVTTVDINKHTTHRWPFFLPDGSHFFYLATNHNHSGSRDSENGIYFASLDRKQPDRLILSNDSAAVYASGYLLFHSGTAVMAQKFDSSSGKLSGEAVPIVAHVQHDAGVWRSIFTASQTGDLAYLPSNEQNGSQLTWFDRNGKQVGRLGERSSALLDPRLSPDGKRLAISDNGEIWIYDLARATRTRLTFSESTNFNSQPSWSPDGKTIAYTRSMGASGAVASTVYSQPSGGGGTATSMFGSMQGVRVTATNSGFGFIWGSWTSDMKYFVAVRRGGPTHNVVVARPLAGGDEFVVAAPAGHDANILYFRVSPDNRWITYVSNESGRDEVYISRFPHGEGKWQISNGGGDYPTWTSNGKELFYFDDQGQHLICPVSEQNGDLVIGTPVNVFNANELASGNGFDATTDGKRFIVNLAGEEAPGSLHLVTNWTSDLKK